jgi:hypothetical protein
MIACRWADKNGMATEIGAPTNYAELTIGGVISANGHGTGSNVTNSMVRVYKLLQSATDLRRCYVTAATQASSGKSMWAVVPFNIFMYSTGYTLEISEAPWSDAAGC